MSLEEVIGYVASDELIKVVYALFIQIVFPVFIFFGNSCQCSLLVIF